MSHNTYMHRLSRLVIVKPLMVTKVSPNQVTTARLLAGLISFGCFSLGDQTWLNIGGFIFLFSMLLDRADGDLARLSNQISPFGHSYDLVSDSCCNALAFVGLGIGLRSSDFGYGATLMGIIAGVSIGVILFLVIRLEGKHGLRAGEVEGVAGFDPDDAMLFIPLCIWVNFVEELLIAASIGTPVFLIIFYLFYRKKMTEI